MYDDDMNDLVIVYFQKTQTVLVSASNNLQTLVEISEDQSTIHNTDVFYKSKKKSLGFVII